MLGSIIGDIVGSIYENKYSNKTDVANSMKFQECVQCRRANSYVCQECRNANHFLANDTRKFYYINIEDAPHQGPVEAFLLPYKEVQIDSYVWTEGMKQWDFAGNVLDRRTLTVDYEYCPYCNGKFERHEPLPDYEPVYKCQNCGFTFSYGGTRQYSKSQMEYMKTYYNYVNPKFDNRRDYGTFLCVPLYGPPPPRTNEPSIPSSKYMRTNMMVGEPMHSTMYGTPAINPRSVVYDPPPIYRRRSYMGCFLLIVIILLVLIFLVTLYFVIV